MAVDNRDSVISLEEQGSLSHDRAVHVHVPSQWALRGVVMALREDNCGQSGTCVLIPPEIYDAVGYLAAELPIPAVYLGPRTAQKIKRLLYQDGFTSPGALIMNIGSPNG